MDVAATRAIDRSDDDRPLTEQVLERAPGPRWAWIVLWSAIPLVSPLLFSGAAGLSGAALEAAAFLDLVATQVVLAYVCLVLLGGSGLLGRRARALDGAFADLDRSSDDRLFPGIGSARGPLLLTALVALVVSAGGWLRYGPLPPLAALVPLCLYLVPILTFIWVYVAILVGIDRLGRRRLALEGFPQDRTLGLGGVGSLASVGLGLLLAAAVPVLLAGSDEPVTLGIGLAIVGVAVAVFVLSMWRIHGQMAAAKARHVALTRRLYEEAYAPVGADPRLATLVERSGALSAAQALDERAHDLPTWPIDEGAVKAIAVVVTGVVTSLIVRAILAGLGF